MNELNESYLVITSAAISATIVFTLIIRQLKMRRALRDKEIELMGEIQKREVQLHEQALHVINLNNNLMDLEENLDKIRSIGLVQGKEVQKVMSTVMVNRSMEKEWQQFESYFLRANPVFKEQLAQLHENLTQHDRRLITLIRMDLSNREISKILNIEYRSVIVSRYRLKQKLGLKESETLEGYIQSLGGYVKKVG